MNLLTEHHGLLIFTDASLDDVGGGAIAGIAFRGGKKVAEWVNVLAATAPLCSGNSTLAELAGIAIAVRKAVRERKNGERVVIVTDSRSARSLALSATPLDDVEGERLRLWIRGNVEVHFSDPQEIAFRWVPREKNRAADAAAKKCQRRGVGVPYASRNHVPGRPRVDKGWRRGNPWHANGFTLRDRSRV